jgi:hypothetical protein
MERFAQPEDTQISIPELISEFKRIYEEFLPPGSPNELNLPSKTRDHICKNFKQDLLICKFHLVSLRLNQIVDDLNLATEDVIKSLYRDIYPR